MKKTTLRILLFFLFFFAIYYSNAQNVTISGSCFNGSSTFVLGGDPTLTTINGKPVYYNANASINYQGSIVSAEGHLAFQLASEVGLASNAWVIFLGGQPYFYAISESATAPNSNYLPFDGSGSADNCGGNATVSPVLPTATTSAVVTNRGAKTATLGGSNTDNGTTILNRGIVWSLATNPEVNGAGVTSIPFTAGTGNFTVNANSLPEGTVIYYRAYAENSAGIGYGNTLSFTTNPALSATQSQTIACNGINNGTATVVPSGGKSPYFYSWSPSGGTGATATNLSPTNYSVTITDNEGTSIQKNFTISQNSGIITLVQVYDVRCNGGNTGAIDISPSGGSGSYTYNWGGGITTQDRVNLTAGTYSVTITDTNNCNSTINNIVVGQPATALSALTGGGKTDVSCYGGANGTATVAPTGGTSGYTYSWNTNPVQTTATATGLAMGTYTVTVTDAKGCQTTRSFTIGQPTAPLSALTGGGKTNVSCYGGANGTATVAPTGGTPNYTYSWDTNPVQTTATATGLAEGTYTVTVYDANSCQTSRTFTISQPTAPLSALTGGGKTDVSCNGGANGTATVAPTGGTPGYTYTWNTTPVQTTATAVGLTQGTYTVTVTDANNCQTTRSFTINQPTTPLSAATGGGQTDVSCYGDMNGTATVFATGGTQNYTYSWNTNPVQTTATATGLAAGNYIATVTDANGCQATRSFTINQPTAALNIATGGGKTDVSCNGGANGTATVAPTGGTPGYTYSWNTNPVQTTATATGLAAGTYTVTVTDANSCLRTRSFTIMQPTAPLSTIEGVKQNTSCNRGANGIAQVIASGGTPNYTYSWNTTPVQTTATATGLAAGTYTVTVTDSKGCQTTRSFTITEPPALVASIGSQSDASCNGGTNGYATVDVVGGTGTGTYTYSWAPSGGTASTASGLAAGTYTVTVTDGNSCQTTQSFTISQPSVLSATKSHTDVLCNGGATGTATVTASGGNGSYTYLWAPSGGRSATATGLTQGIYTCTITDGKGCTLTESFTINQPSLLTATTSQINATCTVGGQASVTPSGGVPGYTYLWSPGGATTATNNNLAAGSYNCVITDSNGCSITKNFIISTTNTLVATQSKTDILCNGVNTGSASVVPSGAVGPFTYVWSPSGGNDATASNLAAGNYSVTITSANGCSIVKNFTINAPPAITITQNSQTNVSCNGGSNGSLGVTVTGGTGGYTYLWSPYGGTAATANGLQAGTYTLTVTDINSCTKTQSFTITEPDALNTTTSKTDVSCNGGTNGSATVNVTGGTGAYTYSWAPSGGTAASASGLSAGTYTVTVKDANLCQTTATVVIEELPLLTSTIAKTDVLCNQANNGTATVTPSGGTGTYTYSWSPSGGTAATATGLSPGTYTVTVTDSNGCFTTSSVLITEPSQLSATDSHTNVSCNGGNDGTATVVATGGTGTFSYLWLPSGGTAATATGLSAGTYTVTVTDENNCFTTTSVQITEPTALSVSNSHTNVSCNGGNDGTATVVVTGGTGNYSYLWAPSGGTAATATGLSAGTYTVTVTDENNCFTTTSVQITEPTALSVSNSHTNVSCNGGNDGTASIVVTGGTGNYSYLWSPSGGTDATATGLSAGIYTVTVTDENSCSVVNTITITEPNVLSLTVTSTEVSCYNGNNGSATVSVTGGTAPFSYSWSPSGGNAATATGLVAGSYTVTVTDANSCSASATVEIIQPANPVTLNTLSVSGITTNSVSLSGIASSNGINTDKGECLAEVGFVYATHVNPTTADTKINVTAALGTFTNTLSGLRGNRTYYVKAYAINSNGAVNYGNEINFTTQKYTLTIVAANGQSKVYGTTDPIFNFTAVGFTNGDTNAILNGQLSRDSGENAGKYNITQGTISAGPDYTIVFTGAEFEITKANQTITWNQILEYGCSDSDTVTLTATTDSGLPVSYTIANAELGTISGTTLTISGSGSSTITAIQNGDQNHNAAVYVIKPIEISQSGLIIQQWADVLLFDNKSNNFVAWQWYKNGIAISGAIRQYYNENQPLNGSYYVVAQDKNGNSIKSCPIETTGTTFSKKIKIYPNPVKPRADFTLQCDFSESQLNGAEINVFDITGKLVQTISNVKAENHITAPSQVALYVVVLKLADGQLKTINLLVK